MFNLSGKTALVTGATGGIGGAVARGLHAQGATVILSGTREAVLQEYPEIDDWLAPVFAKLDLPTLQALNGRIQVGGEASQSVAIDWLRSNGFIS